MLYQHPSEEWPPTKTQTVRLVDVFVLGPVMIWGGAAAVRGGSPLAGTIVFAGGFATIIYNAINYGRVKERLISERASRSALGPSSG